MFFSGMRSIVSARAAPLLGSVATHLPSRPPFGALSVRFMKVKSSLQKRCEGCYFVKRGLISYMYCKINPRHKARQGPKRRLVGKRVTR
jgi:ribosomal protein L36